jgi:hypothetical protein
MHLEGGFRPGFNCSKRPPRPVGLTSNTIITSSISLSEENHYAAEFTFIFICEHQDLHSELDFELAALA